MQRSCGKGFAWASGHRSALAGSQSGCSVATDPTEPETDQDKIRATSRRASADGRGRRQDAHQVPFSLVAPGMNWALLGWLARGAPMLVSMSRCASSFRVRR